MQTRIRHPDLADFPMERKRILLAVNKPADIHALKKKLLTSGYEVQVVDNGFAAVKGCSKFKPHLVVAQLQLQKIDGHHLFRELRNRADTKMIAFVLMSPHRSVAERVHSMNLGIDDYITIPFETDEVVLKLEIILNEIEQYEAAPKRLSKGFSGDLKDINLLELLQTLQVGNKSCEVIIHQGREEGVILLNNGELVDASLGDLPAKEALFRLFTWQQGAFRVDIKEVGDTCEFEETTTELLAQGVTFKDEWDKTVRSLPAFTTTVELRAGVSVKRLSKPEVSLLNGITRPMTISEILDATAGNDLETVRALASLLRQKILAPVETKLHEGNGHLPKLHKHLGEEERFDHQVANLISTFLSPQRPAAGHPTGTRKKRNRRKLTDRRAGARRWHDMIGQKNRVCLNRSELLMIREKLSNGRKPCDDLL